MAKAQETFREFLKRNVAPGLRALGFKGSGQNYELPSQDFWSLLAFQKSEYSDVEQVKFTLNVLVASKATWNKKRQERSWLPARPTATTFWGTYVWQHRIGSLTPTGEDLWWNLEADERADVLAGAILWAVEDFALPAMREQMESPPA